jgi:hypothetical protein
MTGNVLYAVGDTTDDVIRFARDGKHIVVRINDEKPQRFLASTVFKIISGGGEGNDRIDASAMIVRCELYGGGGDDTVIAGSADDYACASTGNDVVRGNAGNDLLCGRVGDDVVSGGAGHDTLTGDEGVDVVSGGGGNDLVLGGSLYKDPVEGAPDTLKGGAGHDTAVRNAEADLIDEDFEAVLPGDAPRYPWELDARLIEARLVKTKSGVTSLKLSVHVASGAFTIKYGKARVENGVITVRALGYQDARYAEIPVHRTRSEQFDLGKLKPGTYRLRLLGRGDATLLNQVIKV